MVYCMLCGKAFKSITASHLKSHGITVAVYCARFPNAQLYSKDRYHESEAEPAGPIKCPTCGEEIFGATCCKANRHDEILEGFGLLCLRRYEHSDSLAQSLLSDSRVASGVDLQRWSKETRFKIESIFK